MTLTEATTIYKMRRKAQRKNQDWHVVPPGEEIIHTVEITQEAVNINAQCTLGQRGAICFCEPGFEDYTNDGGGRLIVHRTVVWQ